MSFPCDCHPLASFLFPKGHPVLGGVGCKCVRLHALCRHPLRPEVGSKKFPQLATCRTQFLSWSLSLNLKLTILIKFG